MLSELLKTDYGKMTNFQLDNFVTGMGGGNTDWGRYKQASMELRTRLSSIKSMIIDWMKARRKLTKVTNPIKKLELEWKLEHIVKNTTSTLKTANRFYQQLCALKDRLPTLTESTIKALEDGYWIDRALTFAVMDIMTMGRLDKGTLEMLRAMPRPLAAQVLQAVSQDRFPATQEQFLNARPEPLQLREDDVITFPMLLEYMGTDNELFISATSELAKKVEHESPYRITSC